MSNIDLEAHWNKVYEEKEQESLGWYEQTTVKSWELIDLANLALNSSIIHIGAGTTTLVDEMVNKGFSNMLATDLSQVALDKLSERVGASNIKCVVDDLSEPKALKNIDKVDFWFDRAVLHFLTKENERINYFELLKNKVAINGYVAIAQFAIKGAEKCSGLPVYRYNVDMMKSYLGSNFILVESFNHTYINPGGAERPYVYALFKRV